MDLAKIRPLSLLVAGMLIASCAHHQEDGPEPVPSARTIRFHNNGRDRIQVYLVGQKDNWLLGRLEPMETVTLRLPDAFTSSPSEAVVLAVLPGWSRSLAPLSERRVALSLPEYGSALPGGEWIFVNGQLQGPRR